MNVSKEHKLIWIPYPKSGERTIAEFLGKNNFFYENRIGIDEVVPLSESHFTYLASERVKYPDFDIICSIDNPYRLIINNFKRFSVINWSLKQNTREFLSNKFNEWINPVIFDDVSQIDPTDTTHFFLFPFQEPKNVKTYYLRVDSLEKDLQNIGLFGNKSLELKNQFLPDLSDSYKDIFSYEHAKIIYHLNKSTFEALDYDPFSFTTRELTLKEKVDFIHN